MRARLGRDVLERALIRREQREQLHRQHRGRGEKMLDDGFVRHRPASDPIEVLQAARERRLVVLARRHGLHDRPEAFSPASARTGPPPGMPPAISSAAPGRAHQAVDVGQGSTTW